MQRLEYSLEECPTRSELLERDDKQTTHPAANKNGGNSSAAPTSFAELRSDHLDSNDFAVLSPGGEVVSVKPLDYERRQRYCFLVFATNGLHVRSHHRF
jgi:hypothetical protein